MFVIAARTARLRRPQNHRAELAPAELRPLSIVTSRRPQHLERGLPADGGHVNPYATGGPHRTVCLPPSSSRSASRSRIGGAHMLMRRTVAGGGAGVRRTYGRRDLASNTQVGVLLAAVGRRDRGSRGRLLSWASLSRRRVRVVRHRVAVVILGGRAGRRHARRGLCRPALRVFSGRSPPAAAPFVR